VKAIGRREYAVGADAKKDKILLEMRGKSGDNGELGRSFKCKKNCNKTGKCMPNIYLSRGNKKKREYMTSLCSDIKTIHSKEKISREKNIPELFRKTDVIQMYANRIFQIIFWNFGQLLRPKGRMNGGVKVQMEDGTKARGKDVGNCERERKTILRKHEEN